MLDDMILGAGLEMDLGNAAVIVEVQGETAAESEFEYVSRRTERFGNPDEAPEGSYQRLIQNWDLLVAKYPYFVTKSQIGADSDGTKIYSYAITSNSDKQIYWASEQFPANRKILWLSGIHGHERTVPQDDYAFFSDLLSKHYDNPTLRWIWDHCNFVVVPCICPWGMNNSQRTNKNGVNINRNFPSASWVLSGQDTSNYSGPTAGSELETQAIMSLVNANLDAYLAFNRHTDNSFVSTARLTYTHSELSADDEVALTAFKALDGIIKKHFPIFSSAAIAANTLTRNLFLASASTATGTLDQWFNERAVRGYLIEMSPFFREEVFGNPYYLMMQNINATIIGNLLYEIIQQRETEPNSGGDSGGGDSGGGGEDEGGTLPVLQWEPGAVSAIGGNNDQKIRTRIRTVDAYRLPVGTVISIGSGYEFKVNIYSAWTSSSRFTHLINGEYGATPFTVENGSYYYRFTIRNAVESTVIADDIDTVSQELTMTYEEEVT